jgi:hypothetical protein
MRAFHKSLTLETDLRMRRWRWFFLATVGLFGYAEWQRMGRLPLPDEGITVVMLAKAGIQ